jgi:hypothetical protein
MKTIGLENVTMKGKNSYRLIKNFSRLEDEWYLPEKMFMANKGWPGDWEGRTMLAVILLARITGRYPAYLDEMFRHLDKNLNEKGYLGNVLPENQFDEQQFAGHSWLLRALIEYYLWKKDLKAVETIKNIIQNLFIPAIGFYNVYPLLPEQRVFEGEAAGNLTGTLVNNWFISTDTGCAFIALDGLSQFYEVFGSEQVGILLTEMIERFMSVDFIKLSMQTHASLSAVRGIIRFYKATGVKKYLDFAIDFFDFYVKQGMSENYANYNWFARPFWTEPCAIVDSYIVSMWLFENTKDTKYIEIAQRIYYNAICYAQRPNGGFGCDVCIGAYDEFLKPDINIYEAYWCCTMRGGEGLSKFCEQLVYTDENEILFTSYSDGTYHINDMVFEETTEYPVNGTVNIEFLQCNNYEIKIKFFVPAIIERESILISSNGEKINFECDKEFVCIKVTPNAGMKLALSFKINVNRENTINCNTVQGFHKLFHGVLLLGLKTEEAKEIVSVDELTYIGDGRYQIEGPNQILSPVFDLIDLTEEEAKKDKRQILFKTVD